MRLSFILITLIYFICVNTALIKIGNNSCSTKRIIFSGLVILSISICISLLNEELYVLLTIPSLAIHMIITYLFFNKAKLSSIVYSYLLFITTSTIISGCISIASGIDYEKSYITDLCTNIVILVVFIYFCFSKRKITLCNLYNYVPKSIKILILLLLILCTILTLFVADKSLYKNFPEWHRYIQNISISLIVIVTFFVVYLLSVTISNTRLKFLAENYENQINIQAEHYKELSEANHETRRFKHDFKNMSIAMKQLILENKTQEAIELINSVAEHIESGEKNTNAFKTGNSIADALLSDKQRIAQNINATIKFSGLIPLSCLSPTDICVLLGNTLDNAIEACEKLPMNIQKTINVCSFYAADFLNIQIENPIHKKVIIKNNYIHTTKENKTLHGFGLYSLNAIIKKYKGTLNISSTDTSFVIDMQLYVNLNRD